MSGIRIFVQALLEEVSMWGLVLSLAGYVLGLWIKRRTRNPWANPLLIAVLFVMAILILLKLDLARYQETSKILRLFLTPATVCLALPLYEERRMLYRFAKAILGGVVTGVVTSLLLVYIGTKIFALNHTVFVSLLPKSITTAMGLGLSQELGGMVPLTVGTIVLTGIFGNVVGAQVLRLCGVVNPIAKGIALGSSAHAIGTARAMEMGEVEGAMAGLSIALSGLVTLVLAPLVAGVV